MSSPGAYMPDEEGRSEGEAARLGVLERRDDWRESSSVPRTTGELGLGIIVAVGKFDGWLLGG